MSASVTGRYEAVLAGAPHRFDTCLGTIAAIEERCGDLPIVELVEKAVFGRRARDRLALLAAALAAGGRDGAEAEALAAAATVAEVEAFILALMGALGFTVAPRAAGARTAGPHRDGVGSAREADPFGEPRAGGSGGDLPSAP